MDALSLTRRIWIVGANHHARMSSVLQVQPHEVLTVHGEDYLFFSNGKSKHIVIRDGTIRIPGIQARQHVMSKLPKHLDNRERAFSLQ